MKDAGPPARTLHDYVKLARAAAEEICSTPRVVVRIPEALGGGLRLDANLIAQIIAAHMDPDGR